MRADRSDLNPIELASPDTSPPAPEMSPAAKVREKILRDLAKTPPERLEKEVAMAVAMAKFDRSGAGAIMLEIERLNAELLAMNKKPG